MVIVTVRLTVVRQENCGGRRVVTSNAARIAFNSTNNNRNSEVDQIRQQPPSLRLPALNISISFSL